jgi:hypothetical protein
MCCICNKRRNTTNKDCQRGGEGVDTDVCPNKKREEFQSISHSMGEGVGDVGGLVEKYRTRIWLPIDNYVDCGRGTFSRIAKKIQPGS